MKTLLRYEVEILAIGGAVKQRQPSSWIQIVGSSIKKGKHNCSNSCSALYQTMVPAATVKQ